MIFEFQARLALAKVFGVGVSASTFHAAIAFQCTTSFSHKTTVVTLHHPSKPKKAKSLISKYVCACFLWRLVVDIRSRKLLELSHFLYFDLTLNHRGVMSLEQLRQREDLLTKEMKIGLKYIEVGVVYHKLFVVVFDYGQVSPLCILVPLGSSTPYP